MSRATVGHPRVAIVYAAGVASGSAAGFFSPFWFLGFIPLAAGLVWGAYDILEADDDESSPPPQ